MKQIFFVILCLAFITSCKNADNKINVLAQEQISNADKFLTEAKTSSPILEQVQTAVQNMPEKFKKENPVEYNRYGEDIEQMMHRRNMMLQGMEEAKAELAKLSTMSAEEAKLNYENRILPMMQRYQEAVKSYDKVSLTFKEKIDSLTAVYQK